MSFLGCITNGSAAEVAYELLCTLSRLCVRAEYCQLAVDCGALVVINDVLASYPKCPVSMKFVVSCVYVFVALFLRSCNIFHLSHLIVIVT